MPRSSKIETLALLRKMSGATPEDVHAALAETVKANPAYWSETLSSAEAAAFLGTTVANLAKLRVQGGGPPFSRETGAKSSIRYPSRLELLEWQRGRLGFDPIEHGEAA